MEEEKKNCFVIMPISDVDGYDKGHFTRVYEYLIKPAVESAGYEPVRADDTSKANFIVVDILQQILACDIAICDLSSRNPNVFYELGVRQAFNKKTVLICDERTPKPFDTSGIRTLPYSASLRVDEVKRVIPSFIKCIKDTISPDNKDVNSLIELLSIEKSASVPEKVKLSQDSSIILNAIAEINNKFNSFVNNYKNISDLRGRLFLSPNGNSWEMGDTLYDHSGHGVRKIGRLIDADKDFYYIVDDKEDTIRIQRNATDSMDISNVPF